jgi:hypothetical protein
MIKTGNHRRFEIAAFGFRVCFASSLANRTQKGFNFYALTAAAASLETMMLFLASNTGSGSLLRPFASFAGFCGCPPGGFTEGSKGSKDRKQRGRGFELQGLE